MDMQASREFLAELKVLTNVHHLNLVRLIGYCVEGSLFLVYEYIENGNLSEHLRGSGRAPLSWSTRVQIALDSARGLEYIHEHTVPVYIHRDIKSANILIDKNYRGKVADFGLTKLTEVGSTSMPTRLVGTFGYMPPEYAQYGDVSPKVDVYAFGVVLYELISAKDAIVRANDSAAESKGLIATFEEAFNQPDPLEGLNKLVDPRLGDDRPIDSVRKLAQLAKACTHENPQLRPSMRSIVVALMTLSSSTGDWDIGSFYENHDMVNLMSGRFGSRFFISLLILLCCLSIFGFHHFTNHFQGSPKIAFLFLVRENLPLDFLWHSFFKNADAAKFSIYIHSKPGFVFDESNTVSKFFYNRQLSMSIQVGWGEPSMIEAERLLLEEAFSDPDNQRFVLLSDSCVPLYNFSYIYNYLISSPRSFVESFFDVNETRYSAKMFPIIPEEKWQKGSQWIALIRRHAGVIVHDYSIFPVFKKFCKRRPPLDIVKAKMNNETLVQTEHNCIPDEHYVQTLFMIKALKDEIFRRTLTFSLWNHSTTRTDTTGWHPVTFNYKNADQQYIEQIKDIKSIVYASENRTERCSIDSIDTPCYLFARKFSPGAAIRILTDGVVGPYDPTILLKHRQRYHI